MTAPNRCDVLIAGGGLAGLSLALQLRRRHQDWSVVVLEPTQRPLPDASFKVGESTVELAAHYFGKTLGLQHYLEHRQLRKFGLRFFMSPGHRALHERVEWGPDLDAPLPTYQLDRGRFENDLRCMVGESGASLAEGWSVADVSFGHGQGNHVVRTVARKESAERTIACRWFVDATGRRRFLQRRLGLGLASPHKASAAWFRLPGRVDIEDIVSPEHHRWHARVPGRRRYFSTNHLLGRGYWVWLIPLSTDNTSVGIVTDENIHPCKTYSTRERAFDWLRRFEPHLAKHLEGRRLLDFRALQNFSHLSRRVFSADRWACVGEAGVFLDPFYSPGSDTIALGNVITEGLIARDILGTLTAATVQRYDGFFRSFISTFLESYTNRYEIFGNPSVTHHKLLWDTCLYWAWTARLFFDDALTNDQTLPEIIELGRKFRGLNRRVQDLFSAWAAAGVPDTPLGEDFLAPNRISLFRMLHVGLESRRSSVELLDCMRSDLRRLEEWAVLLFFKALADVHPGLEAGFEQRWVNAWRIGLEPSAWEREGLFDFAAPRSLEEVEKLLTPETRSVPSWRA